jgi:GNAT superfamily N-acetyltransferase
MKVAIENELDEGSREAIESVLGRFNQENNAAYWAAREMPANAPKALNVVARDKAARVLGGLLAETQFSWLKISIMAVAPQFRGRGIGRDLLAVAETEAVKRGCRYSYVDTMEYQAPEFYLKQGYEVAGRLENWDSHGHAKFHFVKRLV